MFVSEKNNEKVYFDWTITGVLLSSKELRGLWTVKWISLKLYNKMWLRLANKYDCLIFISQLRMENLITYSNKKYTYNWILNKSKLLNIIFITHTD